MTISPTVRGVDAELVEVAVASYKNLREVRVPWSPRMVLYGVNGSGKTNLLEAVALACGSRATMWQLARRAQQPRSGSISLLVRTSSRFLPLPPDRLPVHRPANDTTDPLSEPGRVRAEWQFWDMLGIERGGTWSQAMWSGAVDARLAELLTQASDRPLVRHTLDSVSGLKDAAHRDRGELIRHDHLVAEVDTQQFPRRFSRVLALDGHPPEWLIKAADDLPDVFAPFRSWLASPDTSRSIYPDLLSLPATDRAPVQMVWMATERNTDEAWFDLDTEIWQAAVKSRDLFECLADLPVWADSWAAEGKELYLEDVDQRAGIWLAERAASAASEVLRATIPDFGIFADGPWAAGITAYSTHVQETPLCAVGFLERLSSGERVWMDSALAHAAAEVERQGALSQWRGTILDRLSESELLDAAIEAEPQHAEVGYASGLDSSDGRAFDAVIDRLDRRLVSVDDYLEDPYQFADLDPPIDEALEPGLTNVLRDMSARAVFSPAVREIRETPVRLTAYDEPERHLHPAAQRAVAAALDAVRPDHVVVATHSHLLLGRPGWKHLHLAKSPEGIVLNEFDIAELDQAATITAEMGLTRGELLSFVHYVLVVEGIVDRLVLHTLYGRLLDEAGILILPLHGINEINSLTELTIIGELLDVGVGVLADHSRAHHLDADHSPGDATKEERALLELRQQLARRGREVDLFGLKRVDVIAYLDETIITDRFPDFPSWAEIERRSGGRTSFKDAFAEATGRPVTFTLVKQLVEAMASEGRPALGDLPHVVQRIVARAGEVHRQS